MERQMTKRFFAAIMSVAVFAALAPVAGAQSQCPAEVGQAQAMLQKVSNVQAPRSLAGARQQDVQAPRTTQDVQAPRSLAGARQQDVQAPRSSTQDVQAPRSSTQDVQAPRSSNHKKQDVQAPRSSTQDVQAPRSSTQDVQAPRSIAGAKASGGDAIKLVREAEAACKAGKMDAAKAKAIEAIGLMK